MIIILLIITIIIIIIIFIKDTIGSIVTYEKQFTPDGKAADSGASFSREVQVCWRRMKEDQHLTDGFPRRTLMNFWSDMETHA